jgi:hypothetical protein
VFTKQKFLTKGQSSFSDHFTAIQFGRSAGMMMVGSWRTRTSPKKNNNGVALKKVNKVKFLSKSLAKEGSVRKEKKNVSTVPRSPSQEVY